MLQTKPNHQAHLEAERALAAEKEAMTHALMELRLKLAMIEEQLRLKSLEPKMRVQLEGVKGSVMGKMEKLQAKLDGVRLQVSEAALAVSRLGEVAAAACAAGCLAGGC